MLHFDMNYKIKSSFLFSYNHTHTTMDPPTIDPIQIKASILAGIMKELRCDVW